jgi:cardiolipin synthase C
MHHLIAEGIQVRCYHPFDLQRPLRLYHRRHDKLLIVDRQHLVTGGRNIDDAYFGVGDKTYIDMDIYLRGPVAEDAAG